MVKYISIIFKQVKKIIEAIIDVYLFYFSRYYTHIDSMPLWNWFQVQNGNYKALYKVNFYNRIPNFFYNLTLELMFQMEYLDLTILRMRADEFVLRSIAERTNNKSYKFQADILANEIKSKMNLGEKALNLNEFIDFIELTFESIGMIDAKKMTVSRAFSLYHKAVEQNKRLEKMYKKE